MAPDDLISPASFGLARLPLTSWHVGAFISIAHPRTHPPLLLNCYFPHVSRVLSQQLIVRGGGRLTHPPSLVDCTFDSRYVNGFSALVDFLVRGARMHETHSKLLNITQPRPHVCYCCFYSFPPRIGGEVSWSVIA